MKLSHEDQYLLSECLREGVARCPFCYSYSLDLGNIDETQVGRMLRRVACKDCKETWTVEYEASRIQYKGKWYTRYEYWPTYTQVKNIKYQERLAVKHGINKPKKNILVRCLSGLKERFAKSSGVTAP